MQRLHAVTLFGDAHRRSRALAALISCASPVLESAAHGLTRVPGGRGSGRGSIRSFAMWTRRMMPGCVAGISHAGFGSSLRSYGAADLESPKRKSILPPCSRQARSRSSSRPPRSCFSRSRESFRSTTASDGGFRSCRVSASPSPMRRNASPRERTARLWKSWSSSPDGLAATRAYTTERHSRGAGTTARAEFRAGLGVLVQQLELRARGGGRCSRALPANRSRRSRNARSSSPRHDAHGLARRLTRRRPHRAAAWDRATTRRIGIPGHAVRKCHWTRRAAHDRPGSASAGRKTFVTPRLAAKRSCARCKTDGVLSDGNAPGYGLGSSLETIARRSIALITHSGATAGYRAYVGRVPSRGHRRRARSATTVRSTRSDLGAALSSPCTRRPTETLTVEQCATRRRPQSMRESASLNGIISQPPHASAVPDSDRTRMGSRSTDTRAYSQSAAHAYRERERRARTLDVRARIAPVRPCAIVCRRHKGALHVLRSGGRVEAAAKALQRIQGRYASDEAAATSETRMRSDSPRASRSNRHRFAMIPAVSRCLRRPIRRDGSITFRRDRVGAIIGLDVGETRMRTMPFMKRAAPRDYSGPIADGEIRLRMMPRRARRASIRRRRAAARRARAPSRRHPCASAPRSRPPGSTRRDRSLALPAQ